MQGVRLEEEVGRRAVCKSPELGLSGILCIYMVKWNMLESIVQDFELMNPLNFPLFCSSEENTVVV